MRYVCRKLKFVSMSIRSKNLLLNFILIQSKDRNIQCELYISSQISSNFVSLMLILWSLFLFAEILIISNNKNSWEKVPFPSSWIIPDNKSRQKSWNKLPIINYTPNRSWFALGKFRFYSVCSIMQSLPAGLGQGKRVYNIPWYLNLLESNRERDSILFK